MSDLDEYLILEDNVRHSYMGVVWSHKIQEKQADILATKYRILEIVRVVCTSLTSAGLVSLIFTDGLLVKIIVTVLSCISTIISILFQSFNTQASIISHKKAGNDLLAIRERLRILLLKIKQRLRSAAELTETYEQIIKELSKIYSEAPQTTDKAVKEASISLNIKKDNEFSDAEIDANLPKSLKRSQL